MLAGAMEVREAKKVSGHLLPRVFPFGHWWDGGFLRPVAPVAVGRERGV